MDQELAFMPAKHLAAGVHDGTIAPSEVVEAALHQVGSLDPVLHAMITVSATSARRAARRIEQRLAEGEMLGPLAGVPVVVKDVIDTAGLRTTYGSRTYKEHVPDLDALSVQRLKRADAIVIGKSNTPEHAAYVNTTNLIAGTTLNPWDQSLTSGGSSGGSAVALATGMSALALGSDNGGSLRIPAAFNGVVGLRPTPGRVPSYPSPWGFDTYDVQGPMARTVDDVSLFLGVLAGADHRVPIGIAPLGDIAHYDTSGEQGIRLAWSADIGGCLVLDKDIRETFERLISNLSDGPHEVIESFPDLSGLEQAIRPLRALRALIVHSQDLAHLDRLDNELLRELLVSAQRLTAADVARAERLRSDVWFRNVTFFERFDALLIPTTQVAGFGSQEFFPSSLGGEPMSDPLSWALSTYLVSLMGWPAASIPCGFTDKGVPVGLQVVGPRGGERVVLRAAQMLESKYGCTFRRPPLLNTVVM